MAKLADAPDLGLSFYLFFSVSLRASKRPMLPINKRAAVEHQECVRLARRPVEVAQIVAQLFWQRDGSKIFSSTFPWEYNPLNPMTPC